MKISMQSHTPLHINRYPQKLTLLVAGAFAVGTWSSIVATASNLAFTASAALKFMISEIEKGVILFRLTATGILLRGLAFVSWSE